MKKQEMLFWLGLLFLVLFWRGMPLAYHIRVLLHVVYARLLVPRPSKWNEETVLSFRAWPDDLDWNMHLNNSSYNKLCDIARIAHLSRFFSANVNGANGGVLMRFKRSVRPFEAFELRTRLLGSDPKWLWLEHRFVSRQVWQRLEWLFFLLLIVVSYR
jgi:acyl-CoA thioesterase FadM